MLRTVHLFALTLATVIVGSLSVSGAKIAVGGQADTVVIGSSGVTSELSISSPYFEGGLVAKEPHKSRRDDGESLFGLSSLRDSMRSGRSRVPRLKPGPICYRPFGTELCRTELCPTGCVSRVAAGRMAAQRRSVSTIIDAVRLAP